MIIKRIAILFAFTLILSPLRASEPLPVGVDVKEPKLLKKVEVQYPEKAKIEDLAGPVIVDLLINDKGHVGAVKEIYYNPELLDATVTAIKKWEFAPSIFKRKAIPVKATVTIVFTLRFAPFPIEPDAKGSWGNGIVAGAPTLPVLMDKNGVLRSLKNRDATYDENQTLPSLAIIPESDVPFSVIQKKIGQAKNPVQLRDPKYRFPSGVSVDNFRPGLFQAYYSVLISRNGSQLIRLAGNDQLVKPPNFNTDFSKLAAHAGNSSYKSGALLFFTIFVHENGTIMGIESNSGKDDGILKAFSKARVTRPGMRNGVPVPTAVIVAVPVQ